MLKEVCDICQEKTAKPELECCTCEKKLCLDCSTKLVALLIDKTAVNQESVIGIFCDECAEKILKMDLREEIIKIVKEKVMLIDI